MSSKLRKRFLHIHGLQAEKGAGQYLFAFHPHETGKLLVGSSIVLNCDENSNPVVM
jgi:hypothetical protein